MQPHIRWTGSPCRLKKNNFCLRIKKSPDQCIHRSGDSLFSSNVILNYASHRGISSTVSRRRYSDSRIDQLRYAFPWNSFRQWPCATNVPGYSGGPVPDSHRVPFKTSQKVCKTRIFLTDKIASVNSEFFTLYSSPSKSLFNSGFLATISFFNSGTNA